MRAASVAVALAAVASFASPRLAQAQDAAGDEVDDAARVLFERGVEAYRAGDYERALERFEQAYAITGDPELLFNVGTTLDRLRRDEAAIEAFESYLEARPNAPNRAAVERRLEDLRGNLAPEPEPPPPAPTGLHPAVFWSGVGLTAVLGGVLVWSAIDAGRRNDDYEQAIEDASAANAAAGRDVAFQEDVRPLYDDAASAATRTHVLLGVTAGVAVATTVLAFFTDFGGGGGGEAEEEAASEREDRARRPGLAVLPVVAAGPRGGLVGISGRF